MSYHHKGFQTAQELEDFVNGVIVGAAPAQAVFSGPTSLNGLTVLLNDGAPKTVTFVGDSLSLSQVVAQINTISSGAASARNYGRTPPYGVFLAFIKTSLVVGKTGTANPLLGLSIAADATVTAIDKAKLVFLEQDHVSHIWWLLHTD